MISVHGARTLASDWGSDRATVAAWPTGSYARRRLLGCADRGVLFVPVGRRWHRAPRGRRLRENHDRRIAIARSIRRRGRSWLGAAAQTSTLSVSSASRGLRGRSISGRDPRLERTCLCDSRRGTCRREERSLGSSAHQAPLAYRPQEPRWTGWAHPSDRRHGLGTMTHAGRTPRSLAQP
jgi:hypothetical protein